jgi:methylenetetrahydrofolate dehydrogenase (NADP+)/methenyltetrahydrofolate cyclohydrolase
VVRLPENATQEHLYKYKEIEKLNLNDKSHGIFIQLPLPKHIIESKVLISISPDKDVDGF